MKIFAAWLAIVLVSTSPAVAEDEVLLNWKFAAGDRFTLSSEGETKTDTTTTTNGTSQEENELETHKISYALTVREVRADGTAVIDIRIQSLDQVQKGNTKNIHMTASRDEEGMIEAKADATMPGVTGEQIEPFFEALVTNMLGVEMTLEIDPRGRVSGSSAKGDLFKDLPDDFPGANLVKLMLEKLLSVDDFAAAVHETFLQLPTGPVKPGDEWDVEYAMSSAGLRMEGKGKAKLDSVVQGKNGAEAKIVMSWPVTVHTREFEKRMDGMMEALLKEMGHQAKVTCDFKSKGKPVSETTHVVEVGRGNPKSSECPELRMKLAGTMKMVLAGGKEVTSELDVTTTTSSKFTWKRQ